jgi:transcriptional regulator with XRE-family HTH domain
MRRDDELEKHGIDLQVIYLDLVKRTGLTRYRIAKATGISETTLSRCASGEMRPTLDMCCKIATLADIRIEITLSKIEV